MIKTITSIDFFPEVTLVTLNKIPNDPANISKILNIIADKNISIDMISQTAPYKNHINLSFTIYQDDLGDVIGLTSEFKKLDPSICLLYTSPSPRDS